MTSGNAIRGSRVGAGPAGPSERGPGVRRMQVSYWCANKHATRLVFAAGAAIPETWECSRCGRPAGRDEHNPPVLLRAEPYKTHLAYLKERRSDSDGAAILAEALARLHGDTPPQAPVPPFPARARRPARPGPGGQQRTGTRRPSRTPDRFGGDGDTVLAKAGTRAGARQEPAASVRKPARTSGGQSSPAPLPDPAAEEWCGDCGYKVTAPGHRATCLDER